VNMEQAPLTARRRPVDGHDRGCHRECIRLPCPPPPPPPPPPQPTPSPPHWTPLDPDDVPPSGANDPGQQRLALLERLLPLSCRGAAGMQQQSGGRGRRGGSAAGVGVSPNPVSSSRADGSAAPASLPRAGAILVPPPVPAVAIATRCTFDGPTVRVDSCRATGAEDDVRIVKSAMAPICMERDRRLPWSSGSASRPTIIDFGSDGGLEGMKRPGGGEGRVGKRDGQKRRKRGTPARPRQ